MVCLCWVWSLVCNAAFLCRADGLRYSCFSKEYPTVVLYVYCSADMILGLAIGH